MSMHRLCARKDLPATGGRGFSLAGPAGSVAVFVVCRGGGIHGYLNRCPHTGVNLDWKPDDFLDLSGELIQCGTHGALFRIPDGYCVSGPCAGKSLTPVTLSEDRGELYLALPEPGSAWA